jgi:hypothetical protein
VEIKRFFRKKEELLNTLVEESKTSNEISDPEPGPSTSRTQIHFGPINFQLSNSQKPWQYTKLGWIPNATTPRAQFMNEVLPSFYQSMYRLCPTARDFVMRFHAEGRRQYDLHKFPSSKTKFPQF